MIVQRSAQGPSPAVRRRTARVRPRLIPSVLLHLSDRVRVCAQAGEGVCAGRVGHSRRLAGIELAVLVLVQVDSPSRKCGIARVLDTICIEVVPLRALDRAQRVVLDFAVCGASGRAESAGSTDTESCIQDVRCCVCGDRDVQHIGSSAEGLVREDLLVAVGPVAIPVEVGECVELAGRGGRDRDLCGRAGCPGGVEGYTVFVVVAGRVVAGRGRVWLAVGFAVDASPQVEASERQTVAGAAVGQRCRVAAGEAGLGGCGRVAVVLFVVLDGAAHAGRGRGQHNVVQPKLVRHVAVAVRVEELPTEGVLAGTDADQGLVPSDGAATGRGMRELDTPVDRELELVAGVEPGRAGAPVERHLAVAHCADDFQVFALPRSQAVQLGGIGTVMAFGNDCVVAGAAEAPGQVAEVSGLEVVTFRLARAADVIGVDAGPKTRDRAQCHVEQLIGLDLGVVIDLNGDRLAFARGAGEVQAPVVVHVVAVAGRGRVVVRGVGHVQAALNRVVQSHREREVRRSPAGAFILSVRRAGQRQRGGVVVRDRERGRRVRGTREAVVREVGEGEVDRLVRLDGLIAQQLDGHRLAGLAGGEAERDGAGGVVHACDRGAAGQHYVHRRGNVRDLTTGHGDHVGRVGCVALRRGECGRGEVVVWLGQQYDHVVAIAARVGDRCGSARSEEVGADRRAFGQAGERARDRVRTIVVDDGEGVAGRWRESVEGRRAQRDVAADRDGAGHVDLVVVAIRGAGGGAADLDGEGVVAREREVAGHAQDARGRAGAHVARQGELAYGHVGAAGAGIADGAAADQFERARVRR